MSILNKLCPIPRKPRCEKKRKAISRKSEVLTSTPYKDTLEEDNVNKKKKTQVKRNFNTKPKSEKTKKCDKGKVDKDREISGTCPACQEFYFDPPETDLIQCKKCDRWYHEICTAYEGFNYFFCELC